MKESSRTQVKIFFLLIGLLPLLSASLLFLSITKNTLKETTHRSLQILAESVAKDISQILLWGSTDIQHLAYSPLPGNASLSPPTEIPGKQGLYKFYDQLLLINPEGKVIPPTLSSDLENYADQSWFRKVKEEKVFTVVLHFLEPPQAVLIFAAPVLDSENNIRYILEGQIGLQRIWEITDKARIGHSGYTMLIDKTGRILAHPDKKIILKFLDSPEFLKKVLQNDFKITSYTLQGAEVLAASSLLTSEARDIFPDWYVVAVQSESEAFAVIKAVESWTWIMLGTGLFFVVMQALESYAKNLKRPVQDRILELEAEREKAKNQAQKLATLNDIAQMISSTLDLEEVLRLAVTTAGEILEADQGVLMLIEKGGGYIRSKYEYHQSKSQTELINIQISLELYPELKKALQTQKPVIVTDVRKDPLMHEVSHLLAKSEVRSVMVFPLILEEKILGLLVLRWHERIRVFKREDIYLGETIANQIAIALNNAQLFIEGRKQEQMKSEVISMAVHDLKTPLAAIIGFSELLMRILSKENRIQEERYLRNILYYANFLLGMIQDTLGVHKMEEGTLKLQEKIVPLLLLIRSVVGQFEVLAEQEGITLVTQIPDHLPSIWVDDQIFIRVMANVLHNGIKHTPRGGKIVLQAEKQENGEIYIKIQDTGMGIPATYLDKIFDKYVQVESRKTGSEISVGLGLYFCKLAMEAHGGRIWAESQEGKGSTFYLTIPSNRVIS
ncbi:MAG TPA: ATP-binding protein [Candidatus Limnocylindrales bacterium]|nr:ATP-binding protein [Candidatus Limnocylindrales bacterium]